MESRANRHFIAATISTMVCAAPADHRGPRHNRGDNEMFKRNTSSRALWRGLALACVIAGSATTTAFAGECPADKMKVNAREEVKLKAVGVSDITLGSIDL